MTNIKKLAVLGAVVLAVGATSVTAFAASALTPAETAAFQEAMLENKIAILNERVAEGTMTQEKADEIIEALKENQVTCDGTGQARVGQSLGAAFGGMMGKGQGQGLGAKGQGRGFGGGQGIGQGGNGLGNGLGLRDGSCMAQ